MPGAKAAYKIVLIGEPGVGKTSLIRRYVQDSFDEGYLATLGTRVSKHVDQVTLGAGTVEVNLTIWDIMGNRRILELLAQAYFNGARGALAVFDVTRPETLEALRTWIEAARREEPRMPIIVLGNKSDLPNPQVPTPTTLEFCKAHGADYLATSAKTGENVPVAFKALAQKVLRTFAVLGIAEW